MGTRHAIQDKRVLLAHVMVWAGGGGIREEWGRKILRGE